MMKHLLFFLNVTICLAGCCGKNGGNNNSSNSGCCKGCPCGAKKQTSSPKTKSTTRGGEKKFEVHKITEEQRKNIINNLETINERNNNFNAFDIMNNLKNDIIPEHNKKIQMINPNNNLNNPNNNLNKNNDTSNNQPENPTGNTNDNNTLNKNESIFNKKTMELINNADDKNEHSKNNKMGIPAIKMINNDINNNINMTNMNANMNNNYMMNTNMNNNYMTNMNTNMNNNYMMNTNMNNNYMTNMNANMNNNYMTNMNANMNNNNVKKDPISTYTQPTLIGLNNIGATCFMNATLQCLSQTKALTNYFLNPANENRIINNNLAMINRNNDQLCPVFLGLIKKLWEVNPTTKSFSPIDFRSTLEKMNPLFKQGQPNDSKDFIIFILEQLHKELKQPVGQDTQVGPLNQYDRMNSFNYFFNDFRKECSIISDTFFGFNETINECLYCKNIYNSKWTYNPLCYNYGIFNCLVFPLEEVKNFKSNNMQINDDAVTLYDCFMYNQKTEIFTGDNRNYCNICKQLYDSNYYSKVFISPNVLVLILNRGKNNIYNVKLNFDEMIDLSQFVLQKEKPQLIYELYGVITHIGNSYDGNANHFVASCKSPVDNKWYRYNDAFVNPINNLRNEVIDFGTPYILFYQKK